MATLAHDLWTQADGIHGALGRTYASEAVRLAAGLSSVAGSADIGRMALQSDVNSSWVWTGVLWRHVGGPRPLHVVAGASYTPVVADLDATLETTLGTAVTITLPLVSSLVGIQVNDGIEIVQGGAGQITLAHVSGAANIKSSGTLLSKGQYAFLFAKYIGADVWFVTGDRA